MSRGDEVEAAGADDERCASGSGAAAGPGWLADALGTEAAKHAADTRRIRAAMRKRIEGTARPRVLTRLRGIPRRFAGVPAGIVAGVLCVVMVFAVVTAYNTARSHPPSSPGVTTPPPTTSSTNSGSAAAHIVTATGTVDAASRSGWSQEDVAVAFTEPIAGFQLSVKVSLSSSGSSAGYSSTYDASLFDVSVETQAHALVYKFNLKKGRVLAAGPSRFAVQFNYGATHHSADDTYYVSVYTDAAHGRVPDVAQGTF